MQPPIKAWIIFPIKINSGLLIIADLNIIFVR